MINIPVLCLGGPELDSYHIGQLYKQRMFVRFLHHKRKMPGEYIPSILS